MIKLRDLIPVSGRRYRKSLEIIHSLHKAVEEAKGERALAQRSLHHTMGDLAKRISTWKATENDESLEIVLRVSKAMSRAALKEAPAEFKQFLAQELAARAVGALEELVDDIKIQEDELASHKPSKIIRP
jgi:hypothetical protein